MKLRFERKCFNVGWQQLTGDWVSIAVSDQTVDGRVDRLIFQVTEDLQSLSLTSLFYRLNLPRCFTDDIVFICN